MPTTFASSPAVALIHALTPRYRVTTAYAKPTNGTVYRGVDVETNAPVSIKVITESQRKAVGGASWQALRAETDRYGRMAHERMASLLEVAEDGLGTVLVTTAPSGTSLYRMLANDLRPDRGTVIRWGLECLDLLTEAHASDVIHRFLSEDAVLIDDRARVVLRGFSLTDGSARERLLLAPEQILGGAVDARCDLFSLGLLLGRLLQRGDQVASLTEDDPLRDVLLEAVAQEPGARFDDVLAMADALRAARDWQPALHASPRRTAVLPSSPPATEVATQPQPIVEPATGPVTVVPPAARDEVALAPTVVLETPRSLGRRWGLVGLGTAAVAAIGLGWAFQTGGIDRTTPALPDIAAEASLADAGVASMPAKAMEPKAMPPKATPPETMAEKTMAADGATKTMTPASEASAAGTVGPREAARALIGGGIVGNLFAHADLPEHDAELLADLIADIEGLDFAGDPRGDETIDSLFGVNLLLGDGNPALSDEARAYWLSLGIEEYGTDAAVAHLESQHDHTHDGHVDRAGWYEHVLACERLCGMVVVGLLYEHIKRVQASPHELVRFPVNSAELDAAGLANVKEVLENSRPGDHFLLVGRGSRTGDRAYNLALSQRRVDAVRTALAVAGVDADHLHQFALGYEPPQLTPSLLRRYAIDHTPDAASLAAVNQSVLVVAYAPAMSSTPLVADAY